MVVSTFSCVPHVWCRSPALFRAHCKGGNKGEQAGELWFLWFRQRQSRNKACDAHFLACGVSLLVDFLALKCVDGRYPGEIDIKCFLAFIASNKIVELTNVPVPSNSFVYRLYGPFGLASVYTAESYGVVPCHAMPCQHTHKACQPAWHDTVNIYNLCHAVSCPQFNQINKHSMTWSVPDSACIADCVPHFTLGK